MNTEIKNTADFNSALNNWLEAVKINVLNPQVNDNWMQINGKPYVLLSTEFGNKFVRIVSSGISNRSCWAFVAIADGESKALGQYKAGDIFKPASWKMPAKTARGNIFDNNDPCCGIRQWTGPNYLK